MHRKIYILIDILYTPSQTISIIICGSFQYLHNLKKQVKIEEKFKVFLTADSLHYNFINPNFMYPNFYQFQLELVKNVAEWLSICSELILVNCGGYLRHKRPKKL